MKQPGGVSEYQSQDGHVLTELALPVPACSTAMAHSDTLDRLSRLADAHVCPFSVSWWKQTGDAGGGWAGGGRLGGGWAGGGRLGRGVPHGQKRW